MLRQNERGLHGTMPRTISLLIEGLVLLVCVRVEKCDEP